MNDRSRARGNGFEHVSSAMEALAADWRARAEELHADGNPAPGDALERLASAVAIAITSAMQRTPELRTDRLWTQREAADYLVVSTRYLRESSCPKMLLPGAGTKGQPIVRYDPAAVKAWAEGWGTGSSVGSSLRRTG